MTSEKTNELADDSLLGHYRIVSKIGAGGMGEVYLANDTKLDRKVALKILPSEFAEDADRMSRFVREAKSASALNHPNIITIHEIGEAGGTHFIATEFIDGRTLNDYARSNPLNYKSALEIAIQVVSALDEAHAAGIVHRDIKPDNIMIRANGLAKILDFGIAKLSAPTKTGEEAATAIQAQTQAGMIIGTPNYMSPEQARGRDVDQQTDIFSFGVVFYEMLSGASPFKGETVSDVIAAVLTKEPPRLTNVPPELAEILDKTLQKDKRSRYQTAKDLLDDLKEAKEELAIQSRLNRVSSPNAEEPQTQILQAAATGEENRQITSENLKSIAVLPFTNMSADDDNEYFCDGLAEELLNALAKIDDLKVAARTSAFSFKGKNTEAREIGEKLNVKNVLEGSVRRSGNKLRISVQLVNAADGFHLWSERYDRELKDIFDVQDEIALAVVDALKVKLFGDEKAAVLKRYTDNTEVYEIYLKGRYQFQKHTPEGWQKAIEYFQQAIDLDSEYALALAGLSSVLIFQSFFGFTIAREAIPKAKEAARRALEIDVELDEAHLAVGQVSMFYEWNPEKAAREYQTAIRLNPKSGFAHHQYGLCLSVMEKPEQAIYEADKAMEYEPLSVIGNLQAAAIYLWNDRDEGHLKYANRLIEIAPNFFGGYFMKGVFFLKQGKYEDAIALFKEAASFDNRQGIVKSFLGRAFALAGKKDKAFDCIKELQADLENNKAASYQIAGIYSSIGDLDRTFEWLEKAFEERNGELIYLKLYANWRDGEIWGREFRADPRFRDLLRRIGFSPDKTNQTDEPLEAKTVMLKSEPPTVAGGLPPSSQESEISRAINPKVSDANLQPSAAAEVADLSAKPKSKLWLFGLLGLLVLVGGLFGYKYLSPTNKQIESIAVMPFVNESGNADVEYLSDGMTETLINSLSQIPNLSVKARSSVFRYKGKELDPKKIAAVLNVQAILTGRVVQRGDQLMLNLELIDAQTENVLWGNKYERKSSDLVTLQSEIARDISNKLKSKLSGVDEAKVTKSYTANPEAYQLYLKGRFYWNKRTAESLKQAAEFYKQAIEKDPNYALAYSGLAETYVLFSVYSVALAKDSMPQAKAMALGALEIDDSLAEAHTALGEYLIYYEWDRVRGEKEYRRAIELNPNYATAHQWLGFDVLVPIKRFDEAIKELRRAEELDPLSSIIGTNLADTFVYARRYDEAIAQYKRVLSLDPNFQFVHLNLGWAFHSKGMYREAIAEYRKALELSYDPLANGYLAFSLAKSGQRDAATKLLNQLKLESGERYVQSYVIAIVYIGLGEKDEALNWLEKDVAEHSAQAPFYAVAPELDDLRSEPRFKDLLKRMNLPE